MDRWLLLSVGFVLSVDFPDSATCSNEEQRTVFAPQHLALCTGHPYGHPNLMGGTSSVAVVDQAAGLAFHSLGGSVTYPKYPGP